ncbi:G-protein coupled receptor Mth2-like isoform 2-T2 [Cochliomyia hominivorax]
MNMRERKIALPNGSYIHNNHTLIPPHLVGNYDYEILYNGTKIPASLHKRACICRLKHCITLCSDNIPDFYEDSIKDNADDDNDEEDDAAISTLFNINMTLTNQTIISQNIATDFEHIILDEFCEPFYFLAPQENENLGWTLFENGSLLRQSDNVQLRKNEYCFEFYQKKFGGEMYSFINPLSCAIKVDDLNTMDKINYWFQVFSIPFFLATFIGYCCLSELRNVHGKCFMTYLSCLTLSYAILSYINLSKRKFDPLSCHLLGYLNHYMQLSHYTWLAIICYDTWRSLSDITYMSSYSRYSVYGFYIPFIMTLMTYMAQKLKISNDWKPGITRDKCGLKVDTWAASIYLYGPCFIILIYCLTMFVLTSRIIQNNDQEVVNIKLSKSESPKSRYTLYLRLFLLMGLSWFIDIVSYLCTMFDMDNLSGVIDCVNALQGFYIFVNFIGRRRVRYILRERLLLHIK